MSKCKIPKIIESEFTYRRKFTWTIEGAFPAGNFEEIVLHSIPSRPEKKGFSMSFYDDGQSGLEDLYNVLREFMKHDIKSKEWVSNLGTVLLKQYNARGSCVERHLIENIGYQSAHWGDLDHSSNDLTFIEVNWRYQKCQMFFSSLPTSDQTINDLSKSLNNTQISLCTKPEMNIATQMI